jgi:hypothetical protein
MLIGCVLQYIKSWNKSLPYAEFSYNICYQESWKIALFKMIYGHRCQTSLFWIRRENGNFLGPTNCKKSWDKFVWLRKNMRIVRSRQKSYIDHRRRKLSFEAGDYVYLKVSLMRGLRCFKLWGKLAPRFFDPFKVTKEREEGLKAEFPNFFFDPSKSRGRDSFKGIGLSHPKISKFGMWLNSLKFKTFLIRKKFTFGLF